MADNRISMPSGIGGLVNYGTSTDSKLKLTPEHVIGLIALVLVLEIVLHMI